MSGKLNIAVFVSGRGSNFQAILHAIKEGKIPNSEIVLVVSSNSTAGACEIARQNDIPAITLRSKEFPSENEFAEALTGALEERGVNFVALAGYLKMLPAKLVQRFRNRIVNIHPALLPAFGGKGMYGYFVHEAVIASGAKKSGATVHIVDEEYDRGPIVLQQTVDVAESDTPETLAEKVLKIEHQIYPEAIRLFAEGQVTVEGRIVAIR